MIFFGRRRLPLEDRLLVDAALTEAFAPLRLRTANVSAARVRAAARWSRPERARLGGIAFLARISELSVAAAVSALMFGGTLAAVSAAPESPDIPRDAVNVGRWDLNGRIAYQRPMDVRTADNRTTVGDIALNAAIARRAASATDSDQVHVEQISSNH